MSIYSSYFTSKDAYSLTFPSLKKKKEEKATRDCEKTCLRILYEIALDLTKEFTQFTNPSKISLELKTDPLLEMGFQDPEVLYETTHKTNRLALDLLALCKQRELNLSYDSEDQAFLITNSSQSDMFQIQRAIFRKHKTNSFKESCPHFHFHNKTIYCNLGFSYSSHLLSWNKRLSAFDNNIFCNHPLLRLPSGRFYSNENFTSHSFFKYTLEKHNLFEFLSSFVKRNDFQKNYNDFLENITQENWLQFYTSNLRSLCYLSLIAFLDDQIKQDELFTIHMVASALEEASQEQPAEITVLRKENARKYLSTAEYPLFSFTDRAEQDPEEIFQKFISLLPEKSPIQRTAIAYAFSSSSEEDNVDLPTEKIRGRAIEHEIFNRISWGKKTVQDINDYANAFNMIVLLPPSLCLEFYELASCLEKPPIKEYTWMFGYNDNKESLEALSIGRPISIASPIFKTPYVHGSIRGKLLGITAHDLLYHVAIDWKNPHTKLFAQLGMNIIKESKKNKAIKKVGIDLLDRDVLSYYSALSNSTQEEKKLQTFWLAITKLLIKDPSYIRFYDTLSLVLKKTLPSTFLNPTPLDLAIEYYEDKLQDGFSSREYSYLARISFLKTFLKDLTT